jgi:hypothetical protein
VRLQQVAHAVQREALVARRRHHIRPEVEQQVVVHEQSRAPPDALAATFTRGLTVFAPAKDRGIPLRRAGAKEKDVHGVRLAASR